MSNCDWSVLELDGLMDLIQSAAASVARTHSMGMYTEEDLVQEGYLWCAENADQVRALHARADKLLSLRVWSRLANKIAPEERHAENTIGLHRLYEMAE